MTSLPPIPPSPQGHHKKTLGDQAKRIDLLWIRFLPGLYHTTPYQHHLGPPEAGVPQRYRIQRDLQRTSWWIVEARVLTDTPWTLVSFHPTLRKAKRAAQEHLDSCLRSPARDGHRQG